MNLTEIDYINNLIIEELEKINECPFFNLDKTGMPYYDGIIKGNGNQYYHPNPKKYYNISEKNPIKYELKYMNIIDYGKISQKTMSNSNSINLQKIDKIMNNMLLGIKYDTPMIDLVDENIFQEGRHRIIAATNLGCNLVPVYIFNV